MAVEIPLTHGYVTYVDDEDADLAEFKWYTNHGGWKTRYAVRKVGPRGGQRVVHMHRVIAERAGVDLAGKFVDHINGDGLDNRRANLRSATRSQNAANRARIASNTSGFTGAMLCKVTDRWMAVIGNGAKRTILGRFDTREEAARAYDDAARQRYGEYARLNFPRK